VHPFVLGLDDRALCVARGGQVLALAPSAVFNGTSADPAGALAWHALRSRPMSTSTRHLGATLSEREGSRSFAALVAAELGRLMTAHPLLEGERVWIAAPGRVDPHGLGTLLGILQSLSLPVDGFVDCAAVAVASLGLKRGAVVLELGLHHAAVTAVDTHSGQARRRRSVIAESGGLIELYQAWLELISTTMVRRTRFDPLYDAATEQQLFGLLPQLTRDVGEDGEGTAIVQRGEEQIEVSLTRDQFAQAAEDIYGVITTLLHELRPAGTPVAMVMPQPVAELPGLRERLEQFTGCELVTIPEGFAAAATSLLDLPERKSDDPVRLIRRLPLCTVDTLAQSASFDSLGKRRFGGPAPSHLLLEGRAYSLGTHSLVIGREPAGPAGTTEALAAAGARLPVAPRSIALPAGLAGVSRRHCSFVHDSGELVLLDHSTFGTFVNGERVAERVRVHAGDRIRIGEPGIELALIALGDGQRPPDSH
jgi:hypothetical protein